MSLAGGVGIGAGLLYLLDPDKGAKRRDRMLSGAADLASSARHYTGDALGGVASTVSGLLGQAKDYAGERASDIGSYASSKTRGLSDYASDRVDQAREYAMEKLSGESAAHRRLNVSICALSSMALGAAVMYMFDPAAGRNRRRYVRDQAGNLASQAGNLASQATDYAREAGTAIRDKVGNMTGTATETPEQHHEQPTPTQM